MKHNNLCVGGKTNFMYLKPLFQNTASSCNLRDKQKYLTYIFSHEIRNIAKLEEYKDNMNFVGNKSFIPNIYFNSHQ